MPPEDYEIVNNNGNEVDDDDVLLENILQPAQLDLMTYSDVGCVGIRDNSRVRRVTTKYCVIMVSRALIFLPRQIPHGSNTNI